ncbi:MAG: dTDP-4-dehydrorhamnose 3,5-epimerase [Desulfobacterales bacterium C00003060]|nr:MAG: dTDP-4-dehydrorhamnose 3,5-epimerase [Desulfobacterales bacterium S3730MH5]OEU76768.1 MAG: dTDP-4-dehydrorhamnose 3,5-epimerase [Desulfobacterales bacterium C00003060]OEU84934.1 MAG: dTDP-4-dehydrorhamnose 3,5-epimerase [Desulfobacterales bacterium S5133MH4]
MRFTKTSLFGVLLIDPDVFKDDRGFFMETFHQAKYGNAGIDRVFVQDNHSHSKRGTLRGLHYQLKNAQAKLVYVITGEVFDVAVDIRHGSPTFGQWEGAVLSAENKRQIFLPEGFAHGFCVLSETADVIYKCTDLYSPGDEYGIFWADPVIGIDWRIENPVLSKKDSQNPNLSEVPEDLLPVYKET